MSRPAAATPVRARVPTLRKMVELCALFSTERPRWRMQDAARELGWDPATTHRFLKALVEVRMLEVDEDGNYAIGMLPVEMAAVYLGGEPLRQAVLQRCEAISERTGLTCQLGVFDGERLLIVASREGGGALKAAAMLGERLPLHATAGGKAILSQLGEAEVEALLPERLERFTEATITDRAALLEQLRALRGGGVARADGELAPGFHAVGVPLPRGSFDSRPAAMMCAGPAGASPQQWQLAEQLLGEPY